MKLLQEKDGLEMLRLQGLETVPAIMRQPQEQEVLEMALIENLQREDLNPVEEAKGYDRLKKESLG